MTRKLRPINSTNRSLIQKLIIRVGSTAQPRRNLRRGQPARGRRGPSQKRRGGAGRERLRTRTAVPIRPPKMFGPDTGGYLYYPSRLVRVNCRSRFIFLKRVFPMTAPPARTGKTPRNFLERDPGTDDRSATCRIRN